MSGIVLLSAIGACVCLPAADTPMTCPRNGHVTAVVHPATGQGHVIFGGELSMATTTAAEGVVPLTRRTAAVSHRGTTTASTLASPVGVESCPWMLKAQPGNNTLHTVRSTDRFSFCFCTYVYFKKK